MATLESLKQALMQKANETARQPLSDMEYHLGFDILSQGSGAYGDFIAPQLSRVLTPFFQSRTRISVLEIGPGPKSILTSLPNLMKQKIRNYAAFEPNDLHATSLERYIDHPGETQSSLPCLERNPKIYRLPFVLDNQTDNGPSGSMSDLILFCHSMYGMKPHHEYIQHALKMLDREHEGGMVVVFHRYGVLDLAGLVCHQTASFLGGTVRVANNDKVINQFASFIAGFAVKDLDIDEAVRIEWREVCRALGRPEGTRSKNLLFSAPEVMMTFTKHATALDELKAHVPLSEEDKMVKNWEARLHSPAAIIRPTKIEHVQNCVQWALKHGVGLTVLGGGHSSHCFWPSVVSIDMGAFDQIHIVTTREEKKGRAPASSSMVVAEAGCKTGAIISKAMAVGLTVPLGARPSVGAGLWLQGGIGHLARFHGLACDAIIGAVLVGVDSSQILIVGQVPNQHQPVGAVRLENEADEADLLWAIKGAGTNFGIIVSVTFKAFASPSYLIRTTVSSLSDTLDAKGRLRNFGRHTRVLSHNCSADAYLYWDAGYLHLGEAMFEASTDRVDLTSKLSLNLLHSGPVEESKIVDSMGLFETEMYMSAMHSGHGGGKTSTFKRCVFLEDIGSENVADILVAAIEARPSPLCYLHLLQGGGVVNDVAPEATAFGCRYWGFACVITGVWSRDQNGSKTTQAVVQWVYNVVRDLLPLSMGVYGADLGPDPRDAALAAKAFGPNGPRLARLKSKFDSHKVLAYACPLPEVPKEPKFIILTTGESCAGKDYCANIWVRMTRSLTTLTVRISSISDQAKRAYAAISGADLDGLLNDRAYKEQHRSKLTAFFEAQVHQRPEIPMEHFLYIVRNAADADVLFITGMRDEAPVAEMSHLVPSSKLIDIRIQAGEKIRQIRRGDQGKAYDNDNDSEKESENDDRDNNYRPSLVFSNHETGDEAVKKFGKDYLLPYFDTTLEQLADYMVRVAPNFPRQGINFRHVLDIAQQPGGLRMCTDLLLDHFKGNWDVVRAVVCCEAGGFIFAAPVAIENNIPLSLIRKAGKLPPPTISVATASSHISSSSSDDSNEKRIEMGRDAVPKGCPVVVIDDVLATGETLCAVLQLLVKAGVEVKHITVIVVAEFPIHRGRSLLRARGFGKVAIQSLLVYGDS
ncbi:phosphoribosyl transferase domain protein [Xylaria sp. FL1042]|nr:phosphoribosyl transferase domain protein [Xylaria sp. FL1042]